MTSLERLRAVTARLESADKALGDELRAVRQTGLVPTERGARELPASTAAVSARTLETIVLRVGRPVLAIVDGAPRLDIEEAESQVWRARLGEAAASLRLAAQAVGRIDVQRHPQLQWVGTAWLIDSDLVVTNRHVAREFAARHNGQLTFRQGLGGPIGASVDFLREVDREDRFEARVRNAVYIEDDAGPDLAILRLEPPATAVRLQPIRLDGRQIETGRQVAVIGYPARDSRIPDQHLMHSIFGDVYDRKRLAPGQITGVERGVLLHDCSTLGGNSGSVLLDLISGGAVGLHFAGRFLEANYAVSAATVADRLDRVRRGRPPLKQGSDVSADPTMPIGTSAAMLPGSPPAPFASGEAFVEARISDYVDRGGYDRTFLGTVVPLPTRVDTRDVLTFPWKGREEHELRYEHFSVVMSRSRRLCFFSAANIDGREPHRLKRPGWRLDPRIAAAQQIRDECYGSAPRFSRGHMTRREDPIWGTATAAALGNEDSMHVTNTVPQMQPFNAGIWLGLEDYALDHAREDDMRISVFTGPFLLEDDPVRFGVRVPRSFWKVIAFIHDGTSELCATGYTMSQDDFLREEEFVFGQHHTWQTSIRSIEERSGTRFGDLASLDPLRDVEEGPGSPLIDFAGIVFRRA
jgi:endonuclease G